MRIHNVVSITADEKYFRIYVGIEGQHNTIMVNLDNHMLSVMTYPPTGETVVLVTDEPVEV